MVLFDSEAQASHSSRDDFMPFYFYKKSGYDLKPYLKPSIPILLGIEDLLDARGAAASSSYNNS